MGRISLKEYKELLGEAMMCFSSNNTFFIEQVMLIEPDDSLYGLFDVDIERFRKYLNIKITKEKNDSSIEDLYCEILEMRKLLIHCYTCSGMLYATKKIGDEYKKFKITKSFIISFINKNNELSSLLKDLIFPPKRKKRREDIKKSDDNTLYDFSENKTNLHIRDFATKINTNDVDERLDNKENNNYSTRNSVDEYGFSKDIPCYKQVSWECDFDCDSCKKRMKEKHEDYLEEQRFDEMLEECKYLEQLQAKIAEEELRQEEYINSEEELFYDPEIDDQENDYYNSNEYEYEYERQQSFEDANEYMWSWKEDYYENNEENEQNGLFD